MEGRDCDVGCTDEIPGGLGSLCSMHYLTGDLSCILFLHAGCKLASLFDNTPKGRRRGGFYNTSATSSYSQKPEKQPSLDNNKIISN